MSIGIFRYKGYEMPHNPEKLTVTKKQDDGAISIEISGEGEFYGETAVSSADELRALYNAGGKGRLSVPNCGAYCAEMTKLEFILTSTPNLIRYVFSFKSEQKSQTDSGVLYTAETSETLWTLAEKLKCDVDDLVELNAGFIKGIAINVGDKVIIPDEKVEVKTC